jgi:hypothetical protein
MSALGAGCLAEARSTAYVLETMGAVVAGQRWGLGSTSRPAAFKGGWGPEPDGTYLVRQMGLWNHDSARGGFVVTLAAQARDGSFETGQRIVTELARWLAERLPQAPPPAVPC